MDIDAGLDEIRVILVPYFSFYLMFASMPSSELISRALRTPECTLKKPPDNIILAALLPDKTEGA